MSNNAPDYGADFNPDTAANGNQDLRRFIQLTMDDRNLKLRGTDFGKTPAGVSGSSKEPPLSAMAVLGVDGHYLVTITNAADYPSSPSGQTRQIAADKKIDFESKYGRILR